MSGIDPNFTDRCPQYETITTVPFGNITITVYRRSQTFCQGPDEDVVKQVQHAFDRHHDDSRLVAVSISQLKGVCKVQIINAQKNGVEFRYLY